ncbi:MAG: response regulator transcription factor [Cyclobacteriaceae bacterium]|jgi:DNA-binding NarL/FixJ family response regulator|nr:response regulator transcription factor [Cyclobacteriaceae bacterium]
MMNQINPTDKSQLKYRLLFINNLKDYPSKLLRTLEKNYKHLRVDLSDFEQADKIIATNTYDLIIIDVAFPELRGFTLGYTLLNSQPETKILLTTLHVDLWMIQVAYNLKFHGFVSKQSPLEELINAIHSILQGKNYFDKELKKGIYQNIEPRDYYFRKLPKELKDVYRLLVRGISVEKIALKLKIPESTVLSKKKQIFKITKTKTIIDLIVFNYKKENNDLMVFEEMLRYRVKSFIQTDPLFKTIKVKPLPIVNSFKLNRNLAQPLARVF